MYKMGLTNKRMDLKFEELREEVRMDTHKTVVGVRSEMELLN